MDTNGLELLFPKEFIFGASTSAYQIEGCPSADGKGPSIWDSFAHRKGKIKNRDTGDIACAHYDFWREDAELMRKLGLDAYRGSISWSRILPDGTGTVNRKGLDFYSRLADGLLEAGVQPWFTLFHWDLPLALQRRGGFANRDCACWFADYAEIVAGALGDRVKNWFTINEPFEFSCFGHLLGTHAPGLRSPWKYFSVMHHLLLAHGSALERIRSVRPDNKAGIVLSYTTVEPRSKKPGDARAAFLADQFMNRITLDPLLKGRYPEELFRAARIFAPRIKDGDLALISKSADFVGLNYYSRETAFRDVLTPVFGFSVTGKDGGGRRDDSIGRTSMGWEVYPRGLYDLAKLLQTEYGNPPAIIAENGAAFEDLVENRLSEYAFSPFFSGDQERSVRDVERVRFLQEYIGSLGKAVSEGADVKGYFVWSLLDNFEWAEGYRPRFGLVRVEPATLRRTVKDSGFWYAELIRAHRSLRD
ncbi:beta-glucosidase [Treponema zuelzerae]|uniref:Beta-glucosidase n=1 Tax=Teretinema zuelzerae TaxID=156 RepID=A0AAE3EL58_9SPIR|nr:GH1 family beta-glucosidase [Teretinema zuelzerae]MCD1655538.1 beta-glucosidase [Teretinema zuelzerae]